MASKRFTVASNANRSLKAPLIVPTLAVNNPTATNSIRALVLKTAQTKLRLKHGSRIFFDNGKELSTEEDWASIPVDKTLLVSTGEDFIGSLVPTMPRDPEANPNCPVRVLAEVAEVEGSAITQLNATAHQLSGMVSAVGQPDLHPGTRFPIGAVFVSKDWIHPPLIGSDIGCGMSWYTTTLSARKLEGDKAKRITNHLVGLEGPWRTTRERKIWLSSSGNTEGDLTTNESLDMLLGTIGAGNHFAELQVVEHADPGVRPATDSVILLIHSGSRGYGREILERFTNGSENSEARERSIPAKSPKAAEYLSEHDRACTWASLNRDLIALRFLAALESREGDWAFEAASETGGSEFSDDDVRAAIKAAKGALAQRRIMNISHNSVERVSSWPRGQPGSNGAEKGDFYIHRKGAAPANTSSDSNVALPLPGSRGTPTLLLRPKSNEANRYGALTGLSVAHGAGRAMSRAKAAVWVAQKYKGKYEELLRGDNGDITGGRKSDKHVRVEALMERMGAQEGEAVKGGTWVLCDEKELVWEEAVEAYKDVWEVGADLERVGAAEVVGWAKGKVSYKVLHESKKGKRKQ
ncbi:MAG: hypothetical protein M1814_003648 [Vezdaea aestivalis]|nr:MAG: hypothetical protein M1814_003648 [Vezdaea aestivalis]